MSAELLRRAATILRDLAEAACEHPAADLPWRFERTTVTSVFTNGRDESVFEDEFARIGDAEYIATMHPGVGLAIAKWLEDVAAGWMWDADPDDIQTPDGWPLTLDESMDSHALTVALLIVGESND